MPHSFKLTQRIEKAAADAGINVPLHYAEKSKYYKEFTKQLNNAINKQIATVATTENVDRLFLFTKVNLSPQLLTEIATLLPLLKELLNLNEFIKRMGELSGQASIERFGIQGKFVMQNKELIKYFEDHSNLIINSVDETTKEWLANKIQAGKSKLLTPKEIAQSILEEGKVISKVRAEMIVLTETANAISVTQKEVAIRYGIKQQAWRTSIDERVCPICAPLEGKVATIGLTFDGYAHPPAHPRCRCFLEDLIPSNWELPVNPWLGS